MIKCVVIEKFNLNEKDFNQLTNLKRASIGVKEKLYVNDEFECTEELAKYLSGENKYNKAYIQVIEVKPKEEKKTEVKKTTKKKTSKKK